MEPVSVLCPKLTEQLKFSSDPDDGDSDGF